MRKDIIKQAYRLIVAQCAFAAVVVLLWSVFSLNAGLSAVLGALACVLPNLYFAKNFFASAHLTDPHKIMRRFYLNELIKLALSALIIALVLAFLHVNILAFFTGFLAAHLGFWLAPLLATNNKKVTS